MPTHRVVAGGTSTHAPREADSSPSAYYGINDVTYGEMVISEDVPAASVDARAVGQTYERDGGAAREAQT